MTVTMDVHTSVVALLLVGFGGALIASLLRLPRIVPMILLGIALQPAMHPAVMNAPVTVSGGIAVPDSQNPASSIRTMALLIALARGGLSVRMSFFRELGTPVVLLATLPYAAELVVEALVAPSLLPNWYGASTPEGAPSALVTFASASVWAPLSPSIVIPNKLPKVDAGLTAAGRLVLTGAPLEVSTALVTEGVMSGCLGALAQGASTATVLGHIPTYLFGSALYGLAFAAAFYGYVRARGTASAVVALGKPDPSEPKLVFLGFFLLCYTTSIDSIDTPWLVGFFAALCMAMATQYLLPKLADELALSLKPLWYFAECFLFVLTGCVIRPAIAAGASTDLFGRFLAVLVIGQLARMCADVVVSVAWHAALTRTSPRAWTRGDWEDVARRVAFVWFATMPKATLQASLGPKLTATFKANAAPSPSFFIAPSSAIAILYAATIGSLLTFTAGRSIATNFQEKEAAAAAVAAGSAGGGGGDGGGGGGATRKEGGTPPNPTAGAGTAAAGVVLDIDGAVAVAEDDEEAASPPRVRARSVARASHDDAGPPHAATARPRSLRAGRPPTHPGDASTNQLLAGLGSPTPDAAAQGSV